jgi:hypothetical protein
VRFAFEVDVRLATGEFSIAQAADYLEKTVPMDRATALEEAAAFAGPGSGDHLSDRQAPDHPHAGDAAASKAIASTSARHDFVWKNGNRPAYRCSVGNCSTTAERWTARSVTVSCFGHIRRTSALCTFRTCTFATSAPE